MWKRRQKFRVFLRVVVTFQVTQLYAREILKWGFSFWNFSLMLECVRTTQTRKKGIIFIFLLIGFRYREMLIFLTCYKNMWNFSQEFLWYCQPNLFVPLKMDIDSITWSYVASEKPTLWCFSLCLSGLIQNIDT